MVHQLPAANLLEWRMQLKEFAQLNATGGNVGHPSQSSLSSLGSYESKSAPIKMFKCTICHDFETLMRTALLDHVRQQHDHVTIYNCNLCSYSHYIKDRFRRHVKYHTMAKIRCQICDFETVYKWNMERHMRHHAVTGKSNIFACDVCGYAATAKQSITAHKMTHHLATNNGDDDSSREDASSCDGFAVGKEKDVDQKLNTDENDSANVTDYSVFIDGLKQTGTVSSAENTVNVGADDAKQTKTGDKNFNDGDNNEHLAFDCLQLVWNEENASSDCAPPKARALKTSTKTAEIKIKQEILPESVEEASNAKTDAPPLAFSLDGMTISVYKCPYCPFIAQENVRFHKHFIDHAKGNEYACSACAFSGRFAWDVRRHIIGTHRQAQVLSSSRPANRPHLRSYQEYAEILVITERSLDESTIVADINIKSNDGQQLLLVGQYLSLNAPLVADNVKALDRSLNKVFENNWLDKDMNERYKNNATADGEWGKRFRCGLCMQTSQWKHVIEVTDFR